MSALSISDRHQRRLGEVRHVEGLVGDLVHVEPALVGPLDHALHVGQGPLPAAPTRWAGRLGIGILNPRFATNASSPVQMMSTAGFVIPYASIELHQAAIRHSLDLAADVAARVVVVHLSLDRGVKAFVDALGPLLGVARDTGAVLAPENTPLTTPEDFNAVFRYLAPLPEAEGRVGMCLDTGHANLHSGTRNDYLSFVDRLGTHVPIVHWHARENWGAGIRISPPVTPTAKCLRNFAVRAACCSGSEL